MRPLGSLFSISAYETATRFQNQDGPQNAPKWTCTVFSEHAPLWLSALSPDMSVWLSFSVEGKARGTSSASKKALAHDGAAKIVCWNSA